MEKVIDNIMELVFEYTYKVYTILGDDKYKYSCMWLWVNLVDCGMETGQLSFKATKYCLELFGLFYPKYSSSQFQSSKAISLKLPNNCSNTT